MKKVLLLSLSLLLGFSAIAQQRVIRIKDDAHQSVASAKKVVAGKESAELTTPAETYAPQTQQSVVINRDGNFEEAATMETYYDLQSNQYVANRLVQFPDGSVAATATMSHENNQSASDRGTGYNFYRNGEWGDEPETRVEPFKTGWPSIAQWGERGEILLAHGNGHMQCFVREVAGQGEWQYVGALPDYPEGYPYSEYPTWPRVVTCGENHNIVVAVAALQHQVSSDETHVHTAMWRSENPTDLSSWTISYGPLADLGLGYEVDYFSADDYCLAANGNTVALLYSGCMTNSVWMFKSTDAGETWSDVKVWADPYEGQSLDDVVYEDTLFRPMNGTIVVDNSNVVHVALNTFEMIRTADQEPGYYSYWSGRSVDGILYWNDRQTAPIQSEDGNPHHAARLWWPAGEGYVHMVLDSTKWCGVIPMYEGVDWNNDQYYHSGTEYFSKFYGASGHPALACDPDGNLALAYSSPNTTRVSEGDENSGFYYRSIYVSYKSCDNNYWDICADDLTDFFELTQSEALFTCAATNTINPGEFWFSFQADPTIGFYWGSNATQSQGTENEIWVAKVISDHVSVPETEPQDVVYGIYPNPVTGNEMYVRSAMDADANITIVNLVGQTVKQFNKSLHTGNNQITVDLKSGVYFCTITANGFSRTVKFVVK